VNTQPGVNFTNILQAAFLSKVFCTAFICLQFGFVIFWQKDFGAKAAHKMLVKLTPGYYDTHNQSCASYLSLLYAYSQKIKNEFL
jgi:hypothetical protein